MPTAIPKAIRSLLIGMGWHHRRCYVEVSEEGYIHPCLPFDYTNMLMVILSAIMLTGVMATLLVVIQTLRKSKIPY